jgi:hypothetical protein
MARSNAGSRIVSCAAGYYMIALPIYSPVIVNTAGRKIGSFCSLHGTRLAAITAMEENYNM